MKDPWEVYFDSFFALAKRVPFDTAPWAEDSPEIGSLIKAIQKARESLVYHLVEVLKWRLPEAQELASELQQITLEWLPTKAAREWSDLKTRLKDQWTDYKLRKRSR